jgi:outer membrane protein assembly factor BamB
MKKSFVLIACAAAFVVLSVFAGAQVGRGGSEWLTAFADAQRTSWIRTDAKISVETMSKPGFALQWTSKLDNPARGLHGLTQGVSANGVTLFVPMSVVAGSSNNVYGIDNDTGYVVWQRHFDAPLLAATDACPGGITAAATRIVSVVPPNPPPPARGGAPARGVVGYRSVVGEPGEGVPVDARGVSPGRAAAQSSAAAASGAGRRAAAPGARRGAPPSAGIPGAPADLAGTGLSRVSGVAYAISSDGMLHVLGLPSGKDIQRPAPFLPANARWSDAIAVNTTLYAATTGACGGAPNGIWAIDLDSEAKPVKSWKTTGGVIGAVAFTTDGTLIAAIGPGSSDGDGQANSIVALDPNTLELKDWFTQPNTEFVTGPSIFRDGRETIAVGTKDGRILLLDAGSLGGSTHATPLYASPVLVGSGAALAGPALATWQSGTAPMMDAPSSPAPTRWILASINGRLPSAPQTQVTNGPITTGGVIAMKLGESAGAISLEPAWTSHDLIAPATPIIVNGVVFALSTGRPAGGSGRGAAAVLHAYEGLTGKPLWESGRAMTTFASVDSFWSAMGQAYVGASDGTVYAFGFSDERH